MNKLYKNLAIQVHPDRNQDDPYAVQKMAMVNQFKDNPKMLRKLGIKWGFLYSNDQNEDCSWNTYNLVNMKLERVVRKVLDRFAVNGITYITVLKKLRVIIDKKIQEHEKTWKSNKHWEADI